MTRAKLSPFADKRILLNLQLKKLVSGLAIAFISATLCLPNLAFASDRPIRVIFDRDGAFEDYYAILTLALASQQDSPPVKLIGITTMAHGESYCHNSECYPELKQELLGDFSPEEGSIDGLTQKVLAIAQYREAKIYSGCDEKATVINVLNEADDFGKPFPGTEFTPVRVQLPFAGKPALEPCLFHQEFVSSPRDFVCCNEFNRAFRDETLRYILPQAQATLERFRLREAELIDPKKKAARYLATSTCQAYKKDDPLTIVTVGPVTNLARAYSYIERNPQKYGCPKKIKRAVEFIGKACCWRPQFYDDDAKFCF